MKLSFDPHLCVPLDIETTTDWRSIRLFGLNHGTLLSNSYFVKNLRVLSPNALVVTWNGVRFDFPLLHKLCTGFTEVMSERSDIRHIDGMIVAKILYPNEPSYSLNHFAKKFGLGAKVEVHSPEWYDTATVSELSTYLEQDLALTRAVFIKLFSEPARFKRVKAFERALRLEHKIAEMCQEQVEKGVCFDMHSAEKLWARLNDEMEEIEESLESTLPFRPLPASKLHHPPKVQFKKDGSPSAHIIKYCEKYGWAVGRDGKGVYNAYKKGEERLPFPLVEPLVTTARLELSNQAELKKWLLDEGWKPEYWNMKRDPETKKLVKTSPRLTSKETKEICPNLEKLRTVSVAKVTRWLMLRSRRNVIQSPNGTGWISSASRGPDGNYILPSDADTNGANTARWTHRVIANIPRPSSEFGGEMRSFFCARDSKVWVGWDASSLEACMEAHYLYPIDPEASAEIMDGDPHEKNLAAIGPLVDRAHAKTLKYGITYGAQEKKVGNILGVSTAEGKYWFDVFWAKNPALKELRDQIVHEAHSGKVVAIDGRDIGIRSPHSSMNAKFQSAGAIVMKYAMVIAEFLIRREFSKEEAYGLIRYHDEEVWECSNIAMAERVGELGVESIRLAGEYLKLNVPLTGEYKVGYNWAEVH